VTCIDSGASPGVKYFYVATASTSGGTSALSSEANTVTPTTPPTNLMGSATNIAASISWTACPGTEPITYTLSRSSTSGGPYTAIAGCTGISSTNCSDTGISPGNNYYYVVTASNAAGTTANSSELALTAKASPPTNVIATAASSSIINISWTASSGSSPITYIVTRSTTSGTGYAPITSGTCSSGVASPTVNCSDTSASPGTKYYYIVKASTSGGISDPSNEASATSYTNIPAGLTAIAINTTEVNLSWTASTGTAPITYSVKRSTTSGSGYSTITLGTCSSALSATSCADQSASPGVVYYYVVSASTAGGSSGNSSEKSATTPTNTPTNFLATAISSSTINLSWTASPGNALITYTIMRTTTSGSGYAAITSGTCSPGVSSPSTSCTDTSGSPGVQYFYVIQAATSGGVSSKSSEVTTTTFTTPPTGLTATPTSTTSVNLSWTASIGTAPITYTVKRSTTSGSGYASINTGSCSSSVTATSCTDQSANVGTTYYYVVTATTTSNTSANSTEASATTQTTTPTNLSGTATSASNINLSWTASPGSSAITYSIKRTVTSGTGYSVVASGTCSSSVSGTTCTDTSVTAGNTYFYIISATNLGGTTSFSGESSVTTPTNAPTNLAATAISSSLISISWSLSPGNSAITYNVTRSTVSGSGYLSITTGSCSAALNSSTSSCSDTSAAPGTTYYYIIKATNLGGVSPASIEASATTITNAPTGLSAVAPTSSSVNISWTASSGTASITYNVMRSSVSGSSYMPISLGTCSSGVTTTNCTDTSVSPGNKYYYIVTATTAGGISPNSSEANVSMPTTAPTGLTIVSVGTTSIALSWSQSPGSLTSSYTLLRGSVTGGPYTSVTGCTGLNALTCTDSNVTVGNAYFYVVTATNVAGTTAYSNEVTTVTRTNAPTSLSAIGGGGSVNLSWIASPGTSSLISYTISRSTLSSGPYSVVSTGISNTTYNDLSVTTGTTYYYVVSANTIGGSSVNSTQVVVTPISSFTVTNIISSANQIILNWGTATGASTYTVKQSTIASNSGSGTNVTGCIAFASTACTITGLTNNVVYYFTVFANNVGTNSTSSTNTSEVSSIPSANSLSVSGVAPGKVILNWNNIANATSYSIYYSTTSGNAVSGGLIATGCNGIASGTVTCTATGLTNGTPYYFALVAPLSTGGNFQGGEISATPIGSFDITSLSFSSSTSANIVWGSALGASNYLVQYGIAAGSYTGSQGPTTNTSALVNTGLSVGNVYYFRIKAQNVNGSVLSTSEQQITLPTNPPSGLSLTSVSSSNANLTWLFSPGNSAINYTISRSSTAGTGYVAVSSGSCSGILISNSCSDNSVSSGSKYYYVVTATNPATTTANSNELQVTTIPNPPGSLTGVSNSATQNQLTWTAATGNAPNTTYTLSRSSTTGGSYSPVTGCEGISSITCSDNGLSAGTKYFYVVTATNAGGTSANSTELSLTTYTTAPTLLTATASGSSLVNLNWNISPGSASITYNVLRSTTSGSGFAAISSGTCSSGITSPAVTCTDTSATAGNIYYYVVTATNSAGTTANSIQASVTMLTTTPSGLTASAFGTSQVNLNWNISPGSAAITYTVMRSTTSGSGYASISGGTCSSGISSPNVNCTDTSATAGNIYYYVVTATNPAGTTAISTQTSVIMPTTAPSGLTASATSTTSVTLSWTASPGNSAITYTVERSLINGSGYSAITSGTCNSAVPSPTVTCTDTSVTAGNIYYYVVKASNSVATTANSIQANVTMLTTAPSGLTATASSASEVDLSWNISPGSATITYTVQRSLTNGSGYTTITSGTCSSAVSSPTITCTDLSAAPGNTYYYIVTATNSAGTSGMSTQASVTMLTTAPSGLTATATSTTSVTLSWTASPGNSTITYTVQRSLISGSGYAAITAGTCSLGVTSPSVTCTDTSAMAGNIYYYVVKASNSAGATSNSSQASVTMPTTAPTGITATASGVSQVNMSWTISPGTSVITYNVKRSTTSGSGYSTISSGTCSSGISSPTVSCTDTSATAGNIYYYIVTATNTAGTTTNSSEASVTMQTTAPTGLTATAANTTSVTLSWTISPGNSTITYTVQRSSTSGTGYSGIASGTCNSGVSSPTVTCTDTSATAGNIYYYVVAATNSAGTTVNSSQASVTMQTTAPTGLSATAVNTSLVTLSWTISPGNSTITYTVKRSTTNGSGYAAIASGTCNTAVTSPTISCSDTSPVVGNTYYYVVTASNAFGTTGNSSQASIFFSPPINSVAPSYTGGSFNSTTGISTSAAGTTFTGNQGTWSDNSSCSYNWYANNSNVGSSSTYTTSSSDNCRVISLCVTCSNTLGTNSACFPSNTPATNGIGTTALATAYAARVPGGNVSSTGKTQIQNFFNALISNSTPFPDVLYFMRNYQNAGSGSTLYDLYCPAHDASILLSSGFTWNSNGLLGIAPSTVGPNYAIAISPNIFSTSEPSTMVAVTITPSDFTSGTRSAQGVFAYSTSSASSTYGFGFGYYSGNIVFDQFSANTLNYVSSGGTDFLGRSLTGTNLNLKINSGTNSFPLNNYGGGNFVLGNYNYNPTFFSSNQYLFPLNSYISFAAAWTSQALSFTLMENVRTTYNGL
jgi:hypothetical protein